MKNCCYFKLAGITIQVESDLPITETTFSPRLKVFAVEKTGDDVIQIRHHFKLPDLNNFQLGEKISEQSNLTIFRNSDGWIYLSKGYDDYLSDYLHQVTFINHAHKKIEVYSERDNVFKMGDLPLLAFYPSDWLLLSQVLADRKACMFHSSGVILDGRGFLFVGHSGAGKSTMVKMLLDKAEILCDERVIARKCRDGFRIFGTWTHGEIPIFSPASAPLKAILFLKQAKQNRIIPLQNKIQAISLLSACAFKPLTTSDWWEKILSFMDELVASVPCYQLEFDLSGQVVDLLKKLDS